MASKFYSKQFSDINLNDKFFDSLKNDYAEFSQWFKKKSISGEKALIFEDINGIEAFIYLKKETEDIVLKNNILPKINRLKIGTFKLSSQFRGQRLGEGAMGLILWYWQNLNFDEIYITIFDKHTELINLITRFGFIKIGVKDTNGKEEGVYIKNRNNIDYTNPYTSFPFIKSNFNTAGILPINAEYHDKLFPYSELKGQKITLTSIAGNGLSKSYICSPKNMIYKIDMPIFIYRIYQESNQKKYKSVITSFCTITNIHIIKQKGIVKFPFDKFIDIIGNKTVLNDSELKQYYDNYNCVIIEMIYNGYFGLGNNVNYDWLKKNGLFDKYPYQIEYDKSQFIKILEKGNINASNIIIN